MAWRPRNTLSSLAFYYSEHADGADGKRTTEDYFIAADAAARTVRQHLSGGLGIPIHAELLQSVLDTNDDPAL